MHLNPAFSFIKESTVPKLINLKIGTQCTINMSQHIFIEPGRDAPTVIISCFQNFFVFLQIHAQQHAGILVSSRSNSFYEAPGCREIKIPNGGAGKEYQLSIIILINDRKL